MVNAILCRQFAVVQSMSYFSLPQSMGNINASYMIINL